MGHSSLFCLTGEEVGSKKKEEQDDSRNDHLLDCSIPYHAYCTLPLPPPRWMSNWLSTQAPLPNMKGLYQSYFYKRGLGRSAMRLSVQSGTRKKYFHEMKKNDGIFLSLLTVVEEKPHHGSHGNNMEQLHTVDQNHHIKKIERKKFHFPRVSQARSPPCPPMKTPDASASSAAPFVLSARRRYEHDAVADVECL